MKISYPRDEFLSCISLVAGVCSSKTTKPILQCMKFETNEDHLLVLGTDLEVAVRCKLPGEGIIEQGGAALSAIKLLNILKECSGKTVEIQTDKRVCSIESSDGKFKLVGSDPDEFPNIPDFGTDGFSEIDFAKFSKFVTLTTFAAARDMGRYAFNGIRMEVREKGLQMVATDGRRLAVAGPFLEENSIVSSAIVPVKGLQQMVKGLGLGTDTILQLKVDKNLVVMKTDWVEVSARKLEGEFPNYEEVVPTDNDKKICVDREQFHSALRKASITAGDEARAVRLAFSQGLLTISSRHEGVGEAEIEIPIEFEDNSFEITYNPDFILDYLRMLDDKEFRMEFKDNKSAGLFRGNDESINIVMPITSKS